MNNADFWASVRTIIAEGFTPEGLLKLDGYAEQFISGKLVYQRFSPQEQHGCATGDTTNVIASLLAGAEDCPDSDVAETLSEFKRERQRGAKQETIIEQWARLRDRPLVIKKEIYGWRGGETRASPPALCLNIFKKMGMGAQ